MLRKLFPTIAVMVDEWPAEKWLALPSVAFIAIVWLANVIWEIMKATVWA